jgi:hypothetical protein
MDPTIYTVNDLPRFSPWPARLLGIEPWSRAERTPADLLREFEMDKWGMLLAQLERGEIPATLEAVEKLAEDHGSLLCSAGQELHLYSWEKATAVYHDVIQKALREALPASAIVEFGAGYGACLLRLAKNPAFQGCTFMGGDYSPAGVEIIGRLATDAGVKVEAAVCDLTSPTVTSLRVPAGSVIFTSCAIMYQKRLSSNFIPALLALKPKKVVHFEPVYENQQGDMLMDLLRRRYIEANEYNTDLLTHLQKAENHGQIVLTRHEPNVYGKNPLLPISVLEWAPV